MANYKKRFFESILGNREKREVGEFVLFKQKTPEGDFVNLLDKEAYADLQRVKNFKELKKIRPSKEETIRVAQKKYPPITDEEMENLISK